MRRTLTVAARVVVAVVLATSGTVAHASRSTSGVESLPPGNPVVTGTRISSTWMNALSGDLATEITNSLSRDGYGGMRAPLACTDGSVSSPALTFTNETGTGFYRIGTRDLGLSLGGTKMWEQTASGMIENGWVQIAGTTTVGGNVTANSWVQIAGTLTVAGKIDRPSLPTVGQQASASLTYSTSSASPVNVPSGSVTITTTGRPVMLMIQPDGTYASGGGLNTSGSAAFIGITRDGSGIALWQLTGTGVVFPLSVPYLDTGAAAGTHTYQVTMSTNSGSIYLTAEKLVAFEL